MAHMLFSILALLAVVLTIAQAQNAISIPQPSPTLTTPKVGWQPGPTQRGTLALVWSCVATIITCTWSILHLNVPGRYDGPWLKRLRKLKWMAITVVFPEFILAKAVCELKGAIDDLHQMKEYERELNWKIEFGLGCQRLYRLFHLFNKPKKVQRTVVEMREALEKGGFSDGKIVIYSEAELATNDVKLEPLSDKFNDQGGSSTDALEIEDRTIRRARRVILQQEDDISISGVHDEMFVPFKQGEPRKKDALLTEDGDVWSEHWIPWTLNHSYLANMGGLDEQLDGRMYAPITASFMFQRCRLIKSDYNLFPSSQEIEDKSKADLLVKLLAVVQILWLVTSVIARGITKLAVSQLEIITLTFSVMAIITYVANLWKPKDITMPIMLRIPGRPENFGTGSQTREEHELISFSDLLFNLSAKQTGYRLRIGNDTLRISGPVPLISSLTAASTMVFGGLHCIAWNFDFPSRAEILIWQISSVASAALPCLALLVSISLLWLIRRREDVFRGFVTTYMKDLDANPTLWWSHFRNSPLRSQFENVPTDDEVYDRDFSVALSKVEEPASKPVNMSVPEAANTVRLSRADKQRWEIIVRTLFGLEKSWRNLASAKNENLHSMGQLWNLLSNPTFISVWSKYESFVRNKLRSEGFLGPKGTFMQELQEQGDDLSAAYRNLDEFKKICDSVSRSLTICAGVLYLIARIGLLVVAFTSIRSAPEDLYTTSWTRCIPHIS